MTTCRDIITYGLRQAKVLGINASPAASEADMGLVALQSLYDGWINSTLFGKLEDVHLSENAEAEEGKRYYLDGATLTYPDTIEEDGQDRQVRDLALVESFNGTDRTVKVYDRTAWVDLLDLTLDSAAPFAGRGAMGLSACLARSYCEMFGQELALKTLLLARNFEGALAAKQGTTQADTTAVYY